MLEVRSLFTAHRTFSAHPLLMCVQRLGESGFRCYNCI